MRQGDKGNDMNVVIHYKLPSRDRDNDHSIVSALSEDHWDSDGKENNETRIRVQKPKKTKQVQKKKKDKDSKPAVLRSRQPNTINTTSNVNKGNVPKQLLVLSPVNKPMKKLKKFLSRKSPSSKSQPSLQSKSTKTSDSSKQHKAVVVRQPMKERLAQEMKEKQRQKQKEKEREIQRRVQIEMETERQKLLDEETQKEKVQTRKERRRQEKLEKEMKRKAEQEDMERQLKEAKEKAREALEALEQEREANKAKEEERAAEEAKEKEHEALVATEKEAEENTTEEKSAPTKEKTSFPLFSFFTGNNENSDEVDESEDIENEDVEIAVEDNDDEEDEDEENVDSRPNIIDATEMDGALMLDGDRDDVALNIESVKKLRLFIDDYDSETFEDVVSNLSENKIINKLEIYRMRDEDHKCTRTTEELDWFFQIVRSRPKLRKLSLWNFEEYDVDTLSRALESHPHLTNVHLHLATGTVYGNLLSALGKMSYLEQVDLEVNASFPLAELLECENLSSIGISSDYYQFTSTHFEPFTQGLQTNKVLTTLDLGPALTEVNFGDLIFALQENETLQTLRYSYLDIDGDSDPHLQDLCHILKGNYSLKEVWNYYFESVNVSEETERKLYRMLVINDTLEEFAVHNEDDEFAEHKKIRLQKNKKRKEKKPWMVLCGVPFEW